MYISISSIHIQIHIHTLKEKCCSLYVVYLLKQCLGGPPMK